MSLEFIAKLAFIREVAIPIIHICGKRLRHIDFSDTRLMFDENSYSFKLETDTMAIIFSRKLGDVSDMTVHMVTFDPDKRHFFRRVLLLEDLLIKMKAMIEKDEDPFL